MRHQPRHAAARTWDSPVGLHQIWLGLGFLILCWVFSRLS
jgi:hypothetical protein